MNASPPTHRAQNVRARWVLVIAVVLVVLLPHVPVLNLVLRPLGWLGTLVHETGHGLGALVLGGDIQSIQVFADGSGVAHSSYPSTPTWHRAFVSITGLVGPAVASMLLLWSGLGPRLARVGAILLGVALLVEAASVTLGFSTALALGWGVLALLAAWKLPGEGLRLGILVVAVQLALQVYRGSGYLFTAEAHTGAGVMPSDVANVASALGGPYLFWGVGIGLLDVLLLGCGLLGFFFGERVLQRG